MKTVFRLIFMALMVTICLGVSVATLSWLGVPTFLGVLGYLPPIYLFYRLSGSEFDWVKVPLFLFGIGLVYLLLEWLYPLIQIRWVKNVVFILLVPVFYFIFRKVARQIDHFRDRRAASNVGESGSEL